MAVRTGLILKSFDESTTSTTLVPDSELQFIMNPNTIYNIKLFVVAGTSPSLLSTYEWDLDCGVAPVSATFAQSFLLPLDTAYQTSLQKTLNVASTAVNLSDLLVIKIEGIIENGSTSNSFAFRFAVPTGTSATNYTGSLLRYYAL